MRVKKRQIDFRAISMRSMQKDFQNTNVYQRRVKVPEIEGKAQINEHVRIKHISESSSYAKYARYIVGRAVKLKSKSSIGSSSWYCEFVFDEDRKKLNAAAGWSDNKNEYLFDGIKF